MSPPSKKRSGKWKRPRILDVDGPQAAMTRCTTGETIALFTTCAPGDMQGPDLVQTMERVPEALRVLRSNICRP